MALEGLRDVILQKSGEWARQVQSARDRDEARAYAEAQRQRVNADAMAMFREQQQFSTDEADRRARLLAQTEIELSKLKTDAEWAEKARSLGLPYDPTGDVMLQRAAIRDAEFKRLEQDSLRNATSQKNIEAQALIDSEALRNRALDSQVEALYANQAQLETQIKGIQEKRDAEIAAARADYERELNALQVLAVTAKPDSIKQISVQNQLAELVKTKGPLVERAVAVIKSQYDGELQGPRNLLALVQRSLLGANRPLQRPVLTGLDEPNVRGNEDTAEGAAMLAPGIPAASAAPVVVAAGDATSTSPTPRMHRGRRTYFDSEMSPVEETPAPTWSWEVGDAAAAQRRALLGDWISNAPLNAARAVGNAVRNVPGTLKQNFTDLSARNFDPTGLSQWFVPPPRP